MITEAIDLVDNLVRAKIPRETAKQLVDYADKQKDKAVNLQWIAIAILSAVLFGGLWHVSSRIDNARQELKAEMDRRFDKQDRRFDKQDAELKEIDAELKEIKELIVQKR